ncbi:hypothetical protein GGR53DRAFT_20533 [Hypoxylon sp. FL1150]|nr:hypothetical protein GGR53DRAFT_20533 [Hypoxylon sp. FL1150]
MEDSDGDDTSAAMAQAMGFTSFGAQGNPSKRRKYNPHADDAVVATTAAPNAAAVPETKTGSNATPLGVRTRNTDEIDLGEDEEEGLDAPVGQVPDRLEEGSAQGGTSSDPQKTNRSRPQTIVLVDDVQSQIDNIVRIAPPVPGEGSSRSFGTGSRRGGHGNRERYQINWQRGKELWDGKKLPDGQKWWEDYYDPRSNVNPWESLEQKNGLEPRGLWMTWEESKGAMAS